MGVLSFFCIFLPQITVKTAAIQWDGGGFLNSSWLLTPETKFKRVEATDNAGRRGVLYSRMPPDFSQGPAKPQFVLRSEPFATVFLWRLWASGKFKPCAVTEYCENGIQAVYGSLERDALVNVEYAANDVYGEP